MLFLAILLSRLCLRGFLCYENVKCVERQNVLSYHQRLFSMLKVKRKCGLRLNVLKDKNEDTFVGRLNVLIG